MHRSLPNILTGIRIFLVPVFILLSYLPGTTSDVYAAAIFALASFTDFLDGHLARKWKVESRFGTFLDPIADKLLVAAALIILVHKGRADVIPAIAIISREILVSGLREFLAQLQVPMPVSKMGKWKTAIQLIALIVLILGAEATGSITIEWIGRIALWIAAGLTVYSGYAYLKAGLKHM